MLSKEELDAIEKAAGVECRHFIGKGGVWEIVVRAPNEREWEWYLDRREKPQYKVGALKELLFKIVVHPSPQEFPALCTRWPGLPYSETVNLGVQEMMGMIGEEVGKE